MNGFQPGGLLIERTAESEPKKRRKKRLPKVMTHSVAQQVLAAAARDEKVSGPERIRNELGLQLMYRAGLRVSEVCILEPRQIERDGMIYIFDAKGGDGTAYFDPDTINPLLDAYQLTGLYMLRTTSRLMCMPDGSEMNTRYWQRLVRRLKDELGLRGIITPHVFRHSFATELLEEGYSLVEVQSALRHANLQTTAVYLHVRDESLRRKMAQRGRGGDQ